MEFIARLRVQLWYVPTVAAVLVGIGLVPRAQAQAMTSATKSIQLIAIKPASIGINLLSATPVIFNLNGGVSMGSTIPQWSVNWNLPARAQLVRTCVSLAGPLVGSDAGSHAIPAERVQARNESGGRFMSLSGAGCGRSNSLEVSNTYINSRNNKNGSRRDSILLGIDERGLALPPDRYEGTLNIFVEIIESPQRLP